jgi:hypothetical protein
VRGMSRAVAIAASALLVAIATPTSSSGASWALTTALPQSSDAVTAMSCTAANACTSVGWRRDITAATLSSLAERWNGTAWSVQTTANPEGASNVTLLGVDCSSSTACTAVGSYAERSGVVRTLVERWSGTSWSIQRSTEPAGATRSVLNAVACAGASACTAVGSYVERSGATKALAESWNGSSWSLATPTSPGRSSQLFGVACPEAEGCIAVGDFVEASGVTKSLAERHLFLEVWETQTTVDPAGATRASLKAVDCPLRSSCIAVGAYTESGGVTNALAENWNGTAWSTQTAVNGTGARSNTLYAVSCTEASACSAVGSYETEVLTLHPAEAWNGREWTLQASTNQAGSRANIFTSVSCSASTECRAGGSYTKIIGSASAAYRVASGRWSADNVPRPSNTLVDVSCVSATECAAAGSEEKLGSGRVTARVERWNGREWRREELPLPREGSHQLEAISCVTASFCVAVGLLNSPTGIGLIEKWNGSAWTIESFPVPAGTTSTRFGGVSCTSVSACAAFGEYRTREAQGFIAERWNGREWTMDLIPTPVEATGVEPLSIGCTLEGFCVAVGHYAISGGSVEFIAQSEGGEWTEPRLPSSETRHLEDVACASSRSCFAVGYDGERSLIERWNGTEWIGEVGPRAEGVRLQAVSCTSATACMATGAGSSRSTTRAERWNGTEWIVETSPTPEVAPTFLTFLGTCAGANECIAVGSAVPNGSYAEVYS